MTSAEPMNSEGHQEQSAPSRRHRSGEGIVGGLVLITLGLLFLGDRLIAGFHFSDYWPLIFVAMGIGILWKGYRERM
jgi:hypothetical protein